MRDNGVTTYFASDIAYHKEKFERGYDVLINIFGSDHHGYIARLRAALAGLGHDHRGAVRLATVTIRPWCDR